MVDWIMYGKIQEMKRTGLNKSQTSRHLGIDYKTVLKYWDMSPDEYSATRKVAETRTKKADRYKDFVIECLQKYPDMSAAQIYDWIRERTCLETLEFQERAFRTYVKEIRNEYDLRKPEKNRQYEAVDELPMGKQAQVDMGEIILETMTGRRKKIYCFAMVMTHSRQKFALWQEKPFTTDSFIQAHMRAFSYYGGRPVEIVYDQDKILAVSENHGDIIYTEGFQNYVNTVRFDIFLCHGADPESKGKVENVVKYVKHGFAEHRIFRDIDSFNADCVTGEIYAKHPLCHEKGRLIGQKREYRDKSRTIKEQENLLQELFLNDELVMPFLQHIHKEKPRYYRDQLGVIRRLFEEWNTEMLIESLHYCTEREMYSAADLKSTVIYFNELKADKHIKKLHTALPTKYCGNKPQIRDLRLYEEAMERGAVNG